jgi:hypothetical protein
MQQADDRKGGWGRLLAGIIVLAVFYFVILPGLGRLMPPSYLETLKERDIDATPLFYTGSEEAMESYYYFTLERAR